MNNTTQNAIVTTNHQLHAQPTPEERKKIQDALEATKPKIEEAVMHSLSNERASREPLPSVAETLFDNNPLTVKTSIGEVVIRPMVAYDINIFKLINSPFYRIMLGDKTNENDPNQLFADDEESYELIYQFTHSPKETYKLFKNGKEVYKDKVIEEVACVYNPSDAALLVEQIMQHIFHVQLAKVNFDAPSQDNDGKTETTSEDGKKKS